MKTGTAMALFTIIAFGLIGALLVTGLCALIKFIGS